MNEHQPQEPPRAIPPGLKPHFQEYDTDNLDLERDANLVIQRTLEFGNWDEVRWLFHVYGKKQISAYVRQYGERGLSKVVFNYWRKLLGIHTWRKSPFSSIKDELWNR